LFSIKTRRANGEQQTQLIEIQRWLESHPAHIRRQFGNLSGLSLFFCLEYRANIGISIEEGNRQNSSKNLFGIFTCQGDEQ
jgi:hypothetical protein